MFELDLQLNLPAKYRDGLRHIRLICDCCRRSFGRRSEVIEQAALRRRAARRGWKAITRNLRVIDICSRCHPIMGASMAMFDDHQVEEELVQS